MKPGRSNHRKLCVQFTRRILCQNDYAPYKLLLKRFRLMIKTFPGTNIHGATKTLFSPCSMNQRVLIISLFLGLLVCSGGFTVASPKAPSARDKQVATAVAAFLSRAHLNRQGFDELDDEISERWINAYLKSLDPRKMYFCSRMSTSFTKISINSTI